MDSWRLGTEIVWERRPNPPCALRGFELFSISYDLCLLLNEYDFPLSILMHEIVMVLWGLWSDSNPSCLVQNLWESRAFLNRSFCVLEKTPILLWISSISPKPWSNSSIPSVDVFTSPLWSCLQNLVRFGLDLAPRSSSFPKNTVWKTSRVSVFPSTGWTDALKEYASDQPMSRILAL